MTVPLVQLVGWETKHISPTGKLSTLIWVNVNGKGAESAEAYTQNKCKSACIYSSCPLLTDIVRKSIRA